VRLFATAGMRNYRDNGHAALATQIIDHANKVLHKRCDQEENFRTSESFDYHSHYARIIDGDTEALGSWIDANVSFPSGDGKPVGIIEQGGSSMQILTYPYKSVSLNNYGNKSGMQYLAWKLGLPILCKACRVDQQQTTLHVPKGHKCECGKTSFMRYLKHDNPEFTYNKVKEVFFDTESSPDSFKRVGELGQGWKEIEDIMEEIHNENGKMCFRLVSGFEHRAKQFEYNLRPHSTVNYFSGITQEVNKGWLSLPHYTNNSVEIQKYHTLFHSAMFELFGQWIDDEGTYPGDVKFVAGIAKMMSIDKNEDYRLDEQELSDFNKKLRELHLKKRDSKLRKHPELSDVQISC